MMVNVIYSLYLHLLVCFWWLMVRRLYCLVAYDNKIILVGKDKQLQIGNITIV